MFGKKKVTKISVMIKDGLPNFLNDMPVTVIFDELNALITFAQGKNKSDKTATLKLEKIINTELGEKGSTVSDNSTTGAIIGGAIGGTTGAIIGSTTGKKASNLATLKIRYNSDNGQREINLYQFNYSTNSSILLIKSLIDKYITQNTDFTNHVEL